MIHTPELHADRVAILKDNGRRAGRYVLYWMQGAQRVEDNHALEYAVQCANEHGLPPLVLFCLTDGYPEANRRHYRFMLEGLQDVAAGLSARGIGFVCLTGDPVELVVELAHRAALVVTERAYLRVPKAWRDDVAARISCSLLSVDTNLIVPVHVASRKREYAARTLRPRLREHFAQYCRPVPRHEPQHAPPAVELARGVRPVDLRRIDTVLDGLRIGRTPSEVTPYFRGGEQEARRRLRVFLNRSFFSYAAFRNEPQKQAISAMSPYLHFGHVSPLRLALEVLQVTRSDVPAPLQLTLEDAIGGERGPDDGLRENKRAFLEELCVRRELAHNYVEYEPHYDRYTALPEWARRTLTSHTGDMRPAIYDLRTLEAAATDDNYWNAAMTEMVKTGFMHNYMRMYWGKRILGWTTGPEQAYEIILALNNKYFLDGRDPNSYANVGWIFGLHDRPWPARAVFGTVRTMSAAGLERKCDINGYVGWVDRL